MRKPRFREAGHKRIVLPVESKASFNNPAAGRPGGRVSFPRNEATRRLGLSPLSFPSPLSDLLFSLPLETGFLHTCVFSRRAPNRYIFSHPSIREGPRWLSHCSLKKKNTRKGLIGLAQSGALPWANQWPVGVSMEGRGTPEGAGSLSPSWERPSSGREAWACGWLASARAGSVCWALADGLAFYIDRLKSYRLHLSWCRMHFSKY